MKKIILLTFILISFSSLAQDKKTFYNIDRILAGTNTYNIQARYNPDKTFTLKFCNLTPKCDSITDLSSSLNKIVFLASVEELLKTKFLDDTAPTLDDAQKDNIKDLLQKTKDRLEDFKTEAQKTTELIDGLPIEYSGKITMHREVSIIIKDTIYNYKNSYTTNKGIENALASNQTNKYSTLYVDNVYLSFFNNKASTVLIKGKVKIDDVEKEVTINNKQFSIPLRYFNDYGSTNTFIVRNSDGNKIEFGFDYNDVLDYNAHNEDYFNYSIANNKVKVNKDTLSKDVQQRSFFDYFTAILYSDVLAFDGNNTNSLVNAQARLLIPINQRNKKTTSWLRQFTTEVNISLYNGSEENVKLIESKDGNAFSNFELLTKNNLNGKLNLDIFSHEAKGFFSYASLGYNASFYRTTFKKTTTITGAEDEETLTQLFSLSHGPVLNIEIRPQTNFGADVSVSLENLTYNNGREIDGTNIEDLMLDTDLNHFLFKYNIVNVKADFYWLTNAKQGKKGGVFARVGAFYHTDNYNIQPQLSVGYATNLTSFVNRFKAKN